MATQNPYPAPAAPGPAPTEKTAAPAQKPAAPTQKASASSPKQRASTPAQGGLRKGPSPMLALVGVALILLGLGWVVYKLATAPPEKPRTPAKK